MLHLIGLGLGGVEDITVKGFHIVKSCKIVYLESYTSVLCDDYHLLEEFYKRPIILADRELLEENFSTILDQALNCDVALLVVGDPLVATTHIELLLHAKIKKVPYNIVNNASILTAIACCGLQLYKFGETVSIPFWTDIWKPNSFYDKIIENKIRGLHSLCLLDLKIKEISDENLVKKKKTYEAPRYMTINEAICQLFMIINDKHLINPEIDPVCSESTLAVGLARVGQESQCIIADTLSNLKNNDFGSPLHCLIITGELHPVEKEFLLQFRLN